MTAELEPAAQALTALARTLTFADAATLAAREGGHLYYADEDSIAPLWKGERTPLTSCFSGAVIASGAPAIIDDVAACAAAAAAPYRGTFVRSLAIVPVTLASDDGAVSVVAALGIYWRQPRRPAPRELAALEAVAAIAALTLAKVELHRRAQEALSAREEFFARSAASLQTPFGSLQRDMQRIIHALGPGPVTDISETRETARRTATALDALAEKTELIAEIAGAAHGVLALATEAVELGEVVREVMMHIFDEAQAADCALLLTLHTAARGEWDRERLAHIVRALLESAIHYGAKGAVEVHVAANDEVARLVIRSRGLAIPPRELARIFEPFDLAVDAGRAAAATLSLWVARQLVEAHGGRLEVVSEPGAGSSFTVLLPLGHDPGDRR